MNPTRVQTSFGSTSIGGILVAIPIAILIALASPLGAQAPVPQLPSLSVRTIGIAAAGADVIVTIDADGPLPAPTVGALDGPPRIFLDLAGVRTKAPAATPSRDPRVRRVRVALHSVQPLVTRVVVDLEALQPHRVEHLSSRLRIVIGAGPAPAAPSPAPAPVAALPAPATPPAATTSAPRAKSPTTSPTQSPIQSPIQSTARPIPLVPPLPEPAPAVIDDARTAPPPPAPVTSYRPPPVPPSLREVEKYRSQVLGTLERFRLQLPVLESIEDRGERTTELMELAGLEIDRLKQELTAVKPPDGLRVQHDLLVQSARLAGMAIRLRAEAIQTGNSTIMRNATSAAAGAVLMFERACAEVGCLSDRRP